MDTVRETFQGKNLAGAVIYLLLERSCWFALTPLPDDFYEIEVKTENARFLKTMKSFVN
jgi:hypothetical protein